MSDRKAGTSEDEVVRAGLVSLRLVLLSEWHP